MAYLRRLGLSVALAMLASGTILGCTLLNGFGGGGEPSPGTSGSAGASGALF